ncbi:MAG: hypothetical protein LBB27_00305 [Tannerellaceae bacterium]|jgi:hypothetical protein|nr:hypothetical protein [Tannerellaceae bacterium]
MGVFSFYNMRKPRQFDHRPIYWDPKREEMQERVQRIRRELGMEEPLDSYRPQIKGRFVEGTSHLKRDRARGNDHRIRTYKNARLVAILTILLALFWIFFLR